MQTYEADGKLLAIGLNWRRIITEKAVLKDIARKGAESRSSYYWYDSEIRTVGFTPREFKMGGQVVYPAMAAFLRLLRAEGVRYGILLFEVEQDEIIVLGVVDGQPYPEFDKVVTEDEVGEVFKRFREAAKPNEVRTYTNIGAYADLQPDFDWHRLGSDEYLTEADALQSLDAKKSEAKVEPAPEASHRESVLRMIEIETARINEAKPIEKTKEEKEKEAAEAAKKAAKELAKMAAKAKMQPPPPEKKPSNITVEAIYGSAGEYKAKLNIDGQMVSVGRGWRGNGYDLFEIKPDGVKLMATCPQGAPSCVPEVKFSPFPPSETKTSLASPSATIIKPQAVPGQVADLPPVPVPTTNPLPSRR
ncbi:MAG: type 4b pilus protein PilO2 [Betaproteobacteria bacterium]|nr:type 4b pilus protein PilO2 [Betaproteobacteria bacterium]